MSLYEEARKYWLMGLNVIPVIGKASAIKWKKLQTTRATERQLKEFFNRRGRKPTGIAVVNGTTSGNWYCRDFDDLESFQNWCEKDPGLTSRLPIVRTKRGGHVYFRSEHPLETLFFQNGELRGEGSYNLLPPSTHPSGTQYEWIYGFEGAWDGYVDPEAVGLLDDGEYSANVVKTVETIETVEKVNTIETVDESGVIKIEKQELVSSFDLSPYLPKQNH
jgi:hypothetical protein